MARFSNRFALALAVAMVLPEMFPVGALGRAAAQVAVPEPKRPVDDDAAIPDSIAPAPAVLQAVTAGWMTDDERKDFRVLHGIFDDLDLDTPLRRALVALERWRLDDPALGGGAVTIGNFDGVHVGHGELFRRLHFVGQAFDLASKAARLSRLCCV